MTMTHDNAKLSLRETNSISAGIYNKWPILSAIMTSVKDLPAIRGSIIGSIRSAVGNVDYTKGSFCQA